MTGIADDSVSELQSGVVTSPADAMLGDAVARTLRCAPCERAALFERLVGEIAASMSARPQERPWTCLVFLGTDGSRIFRGGVGHSLVIDPEGRMWRARSYEDFDTAYAEANGIHEIDTLTPLYEQMREYVAEP